MVNNKDEQLTFMAVHAHPDDEVFDTGVTFARLASEGVRTVLITATRGECGEIVDPEMSEAEKQETFRKLGQVREQELKNAAAALNVSELHFLDFRDSGMAGTEDNQNPACFHQANMSEAVRRLVKYIREFRPQVIASYDPWGGYGHPDHVQTHRVTTLAFDVAGDARFYPDLGLEAWQPLKLYYTVLPLTWIKNNIEELKRRGVDGPWNNPAMESETWGTPDELVTTRFDGRDFIDNKVAAFRAHKTQISPDNFMLVMPEDMRRDGLGVEYFSLAKSKLPQTTQPEGAQEEDLFAGIR